MKLGRILCLAVLAMLVSTHVAVTQGAPGSEPKDRTLDAGLQKEIIDSVSQALQEVYIFADVAEKMEKHLRQQLKDGVYKDMTSHLN
jgi:hypothetical protein